MSLGLFEGQRCELQHLSTDKGKSFSICCEMAIMDLISVVLKSRFKEGCHLYVHVLTSRQVEPFCIWDAQGEGYTSEERVNSLCCF